MRSKALSCGASGAGEHCAKEVERRSFARHVGWGVIGVEPAVDETNQGFGRHRQIGLSGGRVDSEDNALRIDGDGELAVGIGRGDAHGAGDGLWLGGEPGDEIEVADSDLDTFTRQRGGRVEGDGDIPFMQDLFAYPCGQVPFPVKIQGS